jgi:MoxR-like ATPase
VEATHPGNPKAPDGVKRHLRVGASPRGIQALVWAGKVEALLDNRKALSIDDIRHVAFPALRHRLLLNYEAQAEGVPADSVLDEVLKSVEPPKG